MLTAQDIKKAALGLGASSVSIGSIDRWEGAPLQMDPRQIMPEAKSVIAMAFRIPRGSLRGIEEGTFFSNYSAMGYGGLTYIFMPIVVMRMASMIEDSGYEAFPMGHQSDWRAIDNNGALRDWYSKPVAPGRAAPDVMVNIRIAGFLCGLGEIGYSKVFLTPEFGPRQRIGLIFTDAELEPDPIMKPGTLCNRCMACVKDCPGGAISAKKTVKVNLAGYDVEWGELDCEACDLAFRGGVATNEEVPENMQYTHPMHGHNVKPGSHTPFYQKPANLYNSGQAVCGGRGCVRACMVSLEKRGVLSNTFHNKFRRRPAWSVDWSDYQGIPEDFQGFDPVKSISMNAPTAKESD